jgi:hypothetical protein
MTGMLWDVNIFLCHETHARHSLDGFCYSVMFLGNLTLDVAVIFLPKIHMHMVFAKVGHRKRAWGWDAFLGEVRRLCGARWQLGLCWSALRSTKDMSRATKEGLSAYFSAPKASTDL